MSKRSRLQAMCAGSLGAAASATGKLGMDGSQVTSICEIAAGLFVTKVEIIAYFVALSIRAGLIGLTILLNGVMWGLFMESMQGLNSGEAAVLNTGCNILVSAFLGKTVFGEAFGTFWWVGASLIVCGMALLQYSKLEARGSKLHKA